MAEPTTAHTAERHEVRHTVIHLYIYIYIYTADKSLFYWSSTLENS